MNETKTTSQRFVSALPAVVIAAAIIAPTMASIGMFVSVLNLNSGLRAEMSAQTEIIAGHGAHLASMDARLTAMETDIREIKEDVNALESDVSELKLDAAQIKIRAEDIDRRLARLGWQTSSPGCQTSNPPTEGLTIWSESMRG